MLIFAVLAAVAVFVGRRSCIARRDRAKTRR